MSRMSTSDLIRYHAHLARAKHGPLEDAVRDVANSGERPDPGVRPETMRSLAATAQRILDMSDLVTTHARWILRSAEEALTATEIEQVRDGVAESLYGEFDFGHPVETQNGWDRDGADRMSRPVFLDIGGPETVQVEFGLRFAQGSAEVLAYGTDIDAPAPADTPEI